MKTNRSLKLFLAALVSSGLILAACTPANWVAVKKTSAESNRSLAAGDYQEAIDLQKKLYGKDPGDKKILAGYIRTVGEIKKAGDRARDQGNYGLALGTYRVLLDNWKAFTPFAALLAFKKADVEDGVKICRIALCGPQSRQELKAGNYDMALAVYQAALKDYPGDKTLKAGYAEAAVELKAIGGKALAAHDYFLAGKVDGLLLKNLPSFNGLGNGAALNSQELAEAIKLCSANLTNLGLAEYRKGNLKKAIAIWENLLAFDPENAEIKKAVETAKAQLGKLK